MDFLNVAFLIIGGAICGSLACLFDVSEGLLLVPLVLASERLAGSTSLVGTHIAMGTSLIVLAVVAAIAASRFLREGHILMKGALIAGGAAVFGAATGSIVAAQLEGKTLQQLFALVSGVAALRLFGDLRKPTGEQKLSVGGLLGTGVLSGGVSALTGIGASVVSTPVLYSVHRFPLMKAAGTSSALVLVSAVAAAVGYLVMGWGNALLPPGAAGYFDPVRCLLLSIGTVPGVLLGGRLAGRVKGTFPRKLFALFLLLVALRLFLF